MGCYDGQRETFSMSRVGFLIAFGILAFAGTGLGQTANQATAPKAPPAAQFLIRSGTAQFIKRFDKNGDGVLTRNEAPPFLARIFDKVDTNQDGKLDQGEIDRLRRRLTERFGAAAKAEKDRVLPKARPAQPVVDFDALDRNADGRLSREELKGTPYASRFDEIDTNQDGQIDRREFEEFLQREAQKRQ
jgi:Ca2+-binding EF-hand superfamily protein